MAGRSCKRPHCLPLLALLLLAAPVTAPAASASGTRKIVVMSTGSRIEVVRAWQSGSSYHLELPNSGELVVPASQVRRVSMDAADLPQATTTIVAGNSTAPSASSTSFTLVGADGAKVASAHRDRAASLVGGDDSASESGSGRTTLGAIPAPEVVIARGVRPTAGAGAAQARRMPRETKLVPGMLAGMLSRASSRTAPRSEAARRGGVRSGIVLGPADGPSTVSATATSTAARPSALSR